MTGWSRAERHAPAFGDPLVSVDLDSEPPRGLPPGAIVLGLDRRGRTPRCDAHFDLLLTSVPGAPRPWVFAGRQGVDRAADTLRERVCRRPLASSTLSQVLRCGARLAPEEALVVESLAYSMLLAGGEFRDWRDAHPSPACPADSGERVRFLRDGDGVTVWLANPAAHNAIDARMRDGLCEALAAVLDDPTVTSLDLRGEGRAFSTGGDLGEFGSTPDIALAHAIRTLRAPTALLLQVSPRTTAYLHGACIGSGVEIPAAAGRVVADSGSWFSLPELAMGLIPGAGGTVSITRRIGRHRTLYWAVSGRRLSCRTALSWGLVDEIQPVGATEAPS